MASTDPPIGSGGYARFVRAVTPPAHPWRWPILLGTVALVLAVAWWDDHLHYAVRLDALYFVLIAVVAWFTGPWSAAAVAALAVTLAILPDMIRHAEDLSVGTVLWNAAGTLGVYLVAVFLLSTLRRSWVDQQAVARTDSLTGLPNRRALNDSLEREVERARRYGSGFTFAYLDLDGFKAVNDRYGHDEGDRALQVVGEILSRQLRDADIVARLGGDEFAVLLPETSLDGARVLMERVTRGLGEELGTRGWTGVTVSVGMYAPGGDVPDPDAVVRHADDLMYEAKRAGKNRIRVGGPAVEPGDAP